jgi:hypothetical protein
VAITKRHHEKPSPLARAAVKEEWAAGNRRRLLADRADHVAGSIFLFEDRDPEGDLIGAESMEISAADESARFEKKFSRRLRGLYHDLLGEGMVDDDDLTLFYWPQTQEARVRLALRLREIARSARRHA